MAHVISIVNQKGGVGKTTTAVNVGAALAATGKFVLLVDLDPQANATSGLGIAYQELPSGIYEGMLGQISLKHLHRATAHEGFRIIPATNALAGAGVELVNMPEREFFLRKALLEIRNDFDYILIDNPPSLGLLTINGLVASDSVLVPVQAEFFALEGLGQLMGTVEMIRESLHPDLRVFGSVITMYDARTRLSREVLEELYKYFPEKMFRSVIPRSVRLAEAPSFGKTIHAYDGASKAARAYERLAQEILARDAF